MNSEEVIDRLHQAFIAGRKAPVKWDVDLDKQEWSLPLRYSNMTHLRLAERRALSSNKRTCERARYAAGRGDFPTACREIAIAQTLGARVELCKEAQLLADAEVLAVDATIEFRATNYPASRQILLKNSMTDQTLEDEFGLTGFHAHRIHLLSKHVQLASFAEGPVRALQIAAAAMRYLNGDALDFAEAGDWSQSRIQRLPIGIRRFLVRQLAVEIAAALLYASKTLKEQAVNEFCKIMALPPISSVLEPMTSCYLKALQLSVPPNGCLVHILASADLLNCGAKGAETLWLMCALDAGQSCVQINSQSAHEFRRLSLKEASEHHAFPIDLRRKWTYLSRD